MNVNNYREFEVGDTVYRDPQVSTQRHDGKWEAAVPLRYNGTISERVKHARGTHFSWGQPYCVMCLKTKNEDQ